MPYILPYCPSKFLAGQWSLMVCSL
uniref:Uncharacterized protein n=1 Tax=Arundo donax TaxID=35708 RepID=A0A0A9C793_ARUDO